MAAALVVIVIALVIVALVVLVLVPYSTFCFFVLLVSLCKTDVEKIKQISASFKENPPGSPFVFSGQSSNLDKAAQQLEKLDVPDDVEINASDKGVEVTFRRTVSFEQGSIEISEKAVKATSSLWMYLKSLERKSLGGKIR